jgi:tetratricopeptide (TPR) repeat protein
MTRLIIFIVTMALLLGGGYMAYKLSVVQQQDLEDQLDQALTAYRQGEKGTTLASRKEGFNRALEIYSQMEKQYQPCMSSGKLFYNLANTYFQLGEYPMAILNYYKSLRLQPRDENVKHNLEVSLDKLNLSRPEPPSDIQKIFFFHTYFSLPERLQLFSYFGLTLLATSLLMIAYLQSRPYLKYVVSIIGVLCLILAFSLLYTRYLEPLQGVIVKATYVYRDKGKEYATTSNTPASAGIKVDILDVQSQGQWIKILTPDGTIGYVPEDAIRIITCV